ncbi:MAG: putative signal transducing protein [Candidatus Rokuibacteriota bacterium]
MSGMGSRRAKIIRFPTPPPKTPARPTELVEARRCRDQTEALVVRGLLESEGIPVALRSRLAPSVYPFSVGHQAEVVLLVTAGDLGRARAVLARQR